ncbi:MAG: Arylsulfatase [Lentisphaerae bacterium ADurb.BinA184]|nr:MAG: Arylsulfatase [Lentisphaerae bacterium ADurb.BinA184]
MNFLFINTDQQRVDSLGCYGSAVARTPHLDRLAAEGVRFERCYTTNPVCMPARASWFTGQYPSHHGCWQNGVPLDPASDMIQTRLDAAGYHTALIGKIHLDNIWLRKEKHPSYGFHQLIECEGDPYCKDEYFQWLDEHGLYDAYMAQFKAGGHCERYIRDIPLEFHQNTWITNHVDEYLKARGADGRPFFLSVGFFDPHHPFDPVEPYASRFDPAAMPPPLTGDCETRMTPYAQERRRAYAKVCANPARIGATIAASHAMVAHLDDAIGRILDGLRACGLADSTVVIFAADHGELLGDHGMLHKGPFFFDCSIRVPMIWRFPDAWNLRGVDSGFASSADIAPTVAELAAVQGPSRPQGQALFSRERRARPVPARAAALTEWRGERLNEGANAPPTPAVRCLTTDDWKLVHYEGKDFGELYDRRNDPCELRNLWADRGHRKTVRELRERLLSFILETEPLPRRTDIF